MKIALPFLFAIPLFGVANAQIIDDTMGVLQVNDLLHKGQASKKTRSKLKRKRSHSSGRKGFDQDLAIVNAETLVNVIAPTVHSELQAYKECQKRHERSVLLAVHSNQTRRIIDCRKEARIVHQAMKFASRSFKDMTKKTALLQAPSYENYPVNQDCLMNHDYHNCALCDDRINTYSWVWMKMAYRVHDALHTAFMEDRSEPNKALMLQGLKEVKLPICVTGRWKRIAQYHGSEQPLLLETESLCQGRVSTTAKTREESWLSEATATLSAGFEMSGAGVSASVSAEVSTTAGHTLAQSMTTALTMTEERCKEVNLYSPGGTAGKALSRWSFELDFTTYQYMYWGSLSPWVSWVQLSTDLLPLIKTVETLKTGQEWFTDSHESPACVPGGCLDTFCKTCAPGFEITTTTE